MNSGGIFDLPKREREIAELERQASQPGFWDDPESAQKTMQRLSGAQADIAPYVEMRRRFDDASTLFELAQVEDDPDAYEEEISKELAAIENGLEAIEVKTLLAGPYDHCDAIVELKPGAGGTEACDWAQMLMRMYERWALANGCKVEVLDELPGEVAGISSATLSISGRNAYGMLRSEHGVHRLVRISPFNSAGKRQTSFAAVEVMPKVETDSEVEIKADDLRIDTYRASGAGGQHVNKTSSAIRITHLPSGIVVQCQNERSQFQNKDVAMQILRARLAELKAREEEAKLASLRGEQRNIEWGSQIRSYVFQPYTMVKDLRTKVAIGDVQRVMDGDLEALMVGYLRWRAGQGEATGDGDSDDLD